jgi:hypothetical protein
MPAAFNVPESFRPALDRIAAMSDSEVEQLRLALASAKPTLKIQAFVAQVQTVVKAEIPDLADVIQTLSNMNNARVGADVSVEKFALDISTPLSRRGDSLVDLSSFQKRLVSLLSVDSLAVSARAFDVQHEYEKLFVSSRIVSDVRAVFNQGNLHRLG